MVLDPLDTEIDQACFEQEDWFNMIYGYCS